MKKGDGNKSKSLTKHIEMPMELDTLKPNDENLNDQSQIEVKSITVHDEQKIGLSVDENSVHTSDTYDQNQLVAVMDDSDNVPHVSHPANHRILEIVAQKPNSTVADIINSARTDSGPMVEYANEPLLPLFKACAPLMGIIHNLSFYIQMALNETPEQPPDGLTIDESAAIRLYTIEWNESRQSLYSMLNSTLKQNDRELLRPYFKYLKLFLTALVKLPCIPQSTIWRGVTKDLSALFQPDTPITWWGFSSCTVELTVLKSNMYLGDSGSRTLFSVEAINGRTISAHSHFVTEDEILLLPGTHMIVQSQFSPGADLHIVHLKQVIPQEILLEPPFEGNSNRIHY